MDAKRQKENKKEHHDNEEEENKDTNQDQQQNVVRRRSSRSRRAVTKRVISYAEKHDNDDDFLLSDKSDGDNGDEQEENDDNGPKQEQQQPKEKKKEKKATSKTTTAKIKKNTKTTKATATATASKKRKLQEDNHDDSNYYNKDEEEFSEGEDADDEREHTPKKSRETRAKRKKSTAAAVPSKKKRRTTTISTANKKDDRVKDNDKTSDNSGNDDEDADAEDDNAVNSKKRGRPKKKTGTTAKAKKQRKKANRGPEENRTCPHCKRVFSIIEGLKYHLDHKVCFRKPNAATARTRGPTSNNNNNKTGTKNKKQCQYCQKKFTNVTGLNYHLKHSVCTKEHYHAGSGNGGESSLPMATLSPGQQFVTSYGVVQVIKDDREIPKLSEGQSDNTKHQRNVKYRNNAKSKIAEKIRKRLATVAVTTWTRREYLARLYKKTLQPDSNIDDDESNNNNTENNKEEQNLQPSSSTAATTTTTKTMSQQDVWRAYFDKDPAQKPPPKKYRAVHDNTNVLSEDPNIPNSCAPDRIVECILIPDKRRKIYSLDVIAEDDNDNDNDEESSINDGSDDEYKPSSKTSRDDTKASTSTSITPQQPYYSMRLFLKRRLLTAPYTPEIPLYVCGDCGNEFTSRDGYAYHIKCKVCVKKAEARGEQIRNNLAGIQERVERRLKRLDTVQKLKQEEGDDNDDDDDDLNRDVGYNDAGEQQGNQDDSLNGSAMYPEVYEALGYAIEKASTCVSVTSNAIAASAVAVLSSQVVSTTIAKKKKNPKKPKDPKLPKNLGPPLENPNDVLEKLKAEFETLEKAVAEIPDPVKKVKRKVKKKKKKRKKIVPVVEKAPLRIVDTMVLAEEVDSGRYPSIKRYNGEHSDECIICKKAERLISCDFCSNSTHFSCIRTKLVVKEPEPEDDFMCHKCIQYILQRRVRAEKRRLKKTNSALDNEPNSDAINEDAEENEYEVVAKRGLEVKQLIELLEDAENRLVELAGTAETNDIRRRLLI